MHLELFIIYLNINFRKKPKWSAFPFPDAVSYAQDIEKVS